MSTIQVGRPDNANQGLKVKGGTVGLVLYPRRWLLKGEVKIGEEEISKRHLRCRIGPSGRIVDKTEGARLGPITGVAAEVRLVL